MAKSEIPEEARLTGSEIETLKARYAYAKTLKEKACFVDGVLRGMWALSDKFLKAQPLIEKRAREKAIGEIEGYLAEQIRQCDAGRERLEPYGNIEERVSMERYEAEGIAHRRILTKIQALKGGK